MGARDLAAQAARARRSPEVARITALLRPRDDKGKRRDPTAEELAEGTRLREERAARKAAERAKALAREVKNQGAGPDEDEPAAETTPPPPEREAPEKRKRRRKES